MAVTQAPTEQFGLIAPAFTLPDSAGRPWSLDEIAGPRGTLIVFMCNHCPYVLAIIDRLARDAAELQAQGIGVAGINANDPTDYPEDAFPAMAPFAATHRLPFPYLHDASQAVARAYGAVCTPDFFGFDARRELRYRGRLDSSGRQPAAPDVRRELVEAMRLVAQGQTPPDQQPCIGCSIKWRQED